MEWICIVVFRRYSGVRTYVVVSSDLSKSLEQTAVGNEWSVAG